jgi:hypothetical protein
MKNRPPASIAALSMLGLSLMLAIANASAQSAQATTETRAPASAAAAPRGDIARDETAPAANEEEWVLEDAPPLQVGDSATGLLALQREGGNASPTPRPIDGEVARRSYERYLKSFEFPIPEHFSSTVKTKSDAGGGGR